MKSDTGQRHGPASKLLQRDLKKNINTSLPQSNSAYYEEPRNLSNVQDFALFFPLCRCSVTTMGTPRRRMCFSMAAALKRPCGKQAAWLTQQLSRKMLATGQVHLVPSLITSPYVLINLKYLRLGHLRNVGGRVQAFLAPEE